MALWLNPKPLPEPRGTPENRPMRDASKPANGIEAGQKHFIPWRRWRGDKKKVHNCSHISFQVEPFPLVRKGIWERPAGVKGAPGFGAAPRTLDGEDRFQTIGQEGKAQHATCLRKHSIVTGSIRLGAPAFRAALEHVPVME